MKIGLAYPSFSQYFQTHFPKAFHIEREEQIKDCDLIIFSGGADIDPRIYNEENTMSGLNPQRDKYELRILNIAERQNVKFLGVCRGHQMLNAYFGGKLIQHINPAHPSNHELTIISRDAFEPDIFPDGVNSLHHQGVIREGMGFKILTMAGNVIESTISDRVLSVQYHPEFLHDDYAVPFFNYVKKWALA